MKIEINPRSLLNLENICEVLYKLHPSVLDYLIDMERSLGRILGFNNMNYLSFEQREQMKQMKQNQEQQSSEDEDENENENENEDIQKEYHFDYNENNLRKILKDTEFKEILKKLGINPNENNFEELKRLYKYIDDYVSNKDYFLKLYKCLQLNTDEYIPIKINIEVEDPVIGKKVRELVRALEKTGAPEQFYLNKREIDWEAYFAEGYNFSINKEQKKKSDDIFFNDKSEELKKILIKEKLYP